MRTGIPFQLKGDWKALPIYNVVRIMEMQIILQMSPSYNHVIESVYF
ncbi:MAG: hypothetical protein IPG07_19795 [Crocinitomicaceae bacterium]|nr:hypothetical protein [Crocinitomicaceae bacterium]